MNKYIIEEKELLGLLEASHTLSALEQGGVDNWEWCGESIREYINNYNESNNKSFEEIEEITKDSLKYYIKSNE